jgi:hypothetical protein
MRNSLRELMPCAEEVSMAYTVKQVAEIWEGELGQ